MFDEEEDLPDFESEEAYQEWENQELVKHEKQLEIKKEVFDEFKFQTTKKPFSTGNQKGFTQQERGNYGTTNFQNQW